MSEDIAERLSRLEKRIAHLEDQVAIYQLMATYGPAADSGSIPEAVSLWADDGVYDLHTQVMKGHTDIAEELGGSWHQGLIKQGSAHIVSMPHVTIDGDNAVATCHSRLYRREDEGGYRVLSCSANRWEMERIGGRWRVRRRVSRRLDGSDESHTVLAAGLATSDT
jgi:ketosteroid isomerase-like protein